MNFCPNCGAKIEDSTNTFCTNCGQAFAPGASTGKAAAPAAPQPGKSQGAPPAAPGNLFAPDAAAPRPATPAQGTAPTGTGQGAPPAAPGNLFAPDAAAPRPAVPAQGTAPAGVSQPAQPTASRPVAPAQAAQVAKPAQQPAARQAQPAAPAGQRQQVPPQRPVAPAQAPQRVAPGQQYGQAPVASGGQGYPAAGHPPAQGNLFAPPNPAGNLFDPYTSSAQPAQQAHKPSVSAIFEAANASPTMQQPAQRRQPPPPPAAPGGRGDYYEPPRRKKRGLVILFVVLGLVVSLLAGTFGTLFYLNSPGRTIGQFTTALENRDVAALRDSVTLGEGLAPTAGGWQALCDAFTDAEARSALTAQLNGRTSSGENAPYPAISLAEQPGSLLVKKHTVHLEAVQLFAPSAQEGTRLVLGEAVYEGTFTGEGVLYTGILPGRYQARFSALPGSGVTYTETPQQVDIFATASPATLVPLPGAGGTPAPTPGDEGNEGDEPESTPQEDAATPPTEHEANLILIEFYRSYLDCINAQSLDSLRRITATGREDVADRLDRPGNVSNSFEYTNAYCDASSFVTSEEGGRPALTFNATFEYTYRPRDGSGERTSGSNHQTVQLVYENGEWLVNRFVMVSDTEFDAHTPASLTSMNIVLFPPFQSALLRKE